MNKPLQLKKELLRKSIHLSTSVIPLLYYYGLSKQSILWICLFFTAGFFSADILRMNFDLARRYFLVVFSGLLREDEQNRKFTGASWLFLGMTATFYLFPKEAAIPAVLFLTLADPAAAIAGKKFGSDYFFGKSIEGSLGFYLTASAVILLFTDFSWLGIATALGAAVIEFLPIGINDNILIPLFAGYILHVLG